ncbi:penicillin-binding transpeptidase domain-containing protein [Pseudonocardia benzenivorans]
MHVRPARRRVLLRLRRQLPRTGRVHRRPARDGRLHHPHDAGPRGEPGDQGRRGRRRADDAERCRQHVRPGPARRDGPPGAGDGGQPQLRHGRGGGETATNIVADPSNVFGAGSSFKIFTTAAALEAGTVGFDSALPDPSSACFPVPGSRTCYPVHNDGAGYPDPISLQDALATSPNVAFVGLEEKTGLPAVIAMAQKLGLRTTLASNDVGRPPITDPADPLSKNPQYDQPQSQYYQGKPSFTLGDSPVSTLEMANVSATILSGGVWCPPTPILSVTDRTGAQVPVNQQPCAQVVPPGLAHTLAAGLSRDTTIGTSAAAASAAGWTHPGIGKTGTTNASESVAFVGGVDDYAAASMVFADGPHPQEVCPGTPVHLGQCGSGAFGGTVAAPPYFAAMKAILGGQPDVPVPPPDPAYLEPRDGSSTVHAPN